MPSFRVEAEYLRRRGFLGVRLLAVRAYINGQRAGHLFLIDPGLPLTVLHTWLIRLYGLADRPEVLDELAVQPAPYVPFDGRQANVSFEARDWNQADLPVDGILGMNWFQQYTILSLHMTSDDEPYIELTS